MTANRNSNEKGDYARAVSAALRSDLGDTHQAVKRLVRWTGANERTAKHWLAGTYGPSGKHLVRLMRHSDATLEAVLRLSQRQSAIATNKLQACRPQLNALLHAIDSAFGR
jgi:hypothetical protein